MNIRIATRKSALALWQARHVAALLEDLPEVTSTSLLPLSTRGDEILDRSLQKIGGKGLFIKELEVAMQEGRADLAVHSMKDVPAELPDGFCIAATLTRANPSDALVTRDGERISDLRKNAIIGSSSLRREAQLRAMRPDVEVRPLRGNVNTRLDKLAKGDYDAIVLASAGLERLDLAHHISQQFIPDEMLPAAAQGVLGIECRTDNAPLRSVINALNDTDTAQSTAAERAIAVALQASCQSPVAAYAELEPGSLSLTALVAHPDGQQMIRDSLTGQPEDAGEIGLALSEKLIQQGAADLLRRIENDYGSK